MEWLLDNPQPSAPIKSTVRMKKTSPEVFMIIESSDEEDNGGPAVVNGPKTSESAAISLQARKKAKMEPKGAETWQTTDTCEVIM